MHNTLLNMLWNKLCRWHCCRTNLVLAAYQFEMGTCLLLIVLWIILMNLILIMAYIICWFILTFFSEMCACMVHWFSVFCISKIAFFNFLCVIQIWRVSNRKTNSHFCGFFYPFSETGFLSFQKCRVLHLEMPFFN